MNWQDVVKLARDQLTNPQPPMMPQHTTQSVPDNTRLMQTGMTGIQGNAPPQTTTGGTGGDKGFAKCDYCKPLGLGMDNHRRDFCYVDKNSKYYKPDVRARRIQAAKKKGVQLPDYLQDEEQASVALVCPPCQAEPVSTQDMSGMVDDLIGALRLVGGLQEAQI